MEFFFPNGLKPRRKDLRQTIRSFAIYGCEKKKAMRDLESAGEWCQLERLAQVYADDLASDASGDEDEHLDHGIDPGMLVTAKMSKSISTRQSILSPFPGHHVGNLCFSK